MKQIKKTQVGFEIIGFDLQEEIACSFICLWCFIRRFKT